MGPPRLLVYIGSLALGAAPAACTTSATQSVPAPAQPPAVPGLRDGARRFIRFNQLGYLPAARKVAVVCALDTAAAITFRVVDASTTPALGPLPADTAPDAGAFASCASTFRIDFSSVTRAGTYRLEADGARPVEVRVGLDVYVGVTETLLQYMRQQRSGWNPAFRDSVHRRDAIVVDHPTLGGQFVPVSGGWADASDYLQYTATSANATWVMLAAHRDFPGAFGDRAQADGSYGANGVADVLDEARHGLDWLRRMFHGDSVLFNQIGDDRDHAYSDLPTTDSSDYGWGKGRERPVYPCTGRPQGLLRYKNRADGLASTAGKFAAAFAAASQLHGSPDAPRDLERARRAYELGKAHPGNCQTAPGGAPYFYEEENWADDMELAASQLALATKNAAYLSDGLGFAAREPVTPWMGADTARHYQWYPFLNFGHHELATRASGADRERLARYYRDGLEAIERRATNAFRVGIPFIWCSNNLMVAVATQAVLYRRLTGDARFTELEAAAVDWLLGANPWGVSMIVDVGARFPVMPHSDVSRRLGWRITGGLVDGPVRRSIFGSLIGIRLAAVDKLAAFNTGAIVYHDDYGDYSTNEPTMDGTASAMYLFASLAARPVRAP